MNRQINIIGAGGLGREVKSMLKAMEGIEFLQFIDDNPAYADINISEFNERVDQESCGVIAIGSSKTRRHVAQRVNSAVLFENIIHPQAIIQDEMSVKMGKGVIIGAGSILTCDITVGTHVLINLNCTIGHDVRLGDFCSLMPGVNLGGNVILEEGVFIGTGATILPGIRIGKNSVVGAGAVVTKDVGSGITVKGIPAK